MKCLFFVCFFVWFLCFLFVLFCFFFLLAIAGTFVFSQA